MVDPTKSLFGYDGAPRKISSSIQYTSRDIPNLPAPIFALI